MAVPAGTSPVIYFSGAAAAVGSSFFEHPINASDNMIPRMRFFIVNPEGEWIGCLLPADGIASCKPDGILFR